METLGGVSVVAVKAEVEDGRVRDVSKVKELDIRNASFGTQIEDRIGVAWTKESNRLKSTSL